MYLNDFQPIIFEQDNYNGLVAYEYNESFIASRSEIDDIVFSNETIYFVPKYNIETPERTMNACNILRIPENIHELDIDLEYIDSTMKCLFNVINKPIASFVFNGENFHTYYILENFLSKEFIMNAFTP